MFGSYPSIEVALNDLNSVDKSLKRSACFYLGQMKSKKAVKPLIELLNDEDAYVRRQAIIALGKIGDDRAVVPLIECLKDKAVIVRADSALVLGELGDYRVIEPLKELLGDKNDSVKKSASDAINLIEPTEKTHNVPEWNGYYPSLDSATEEQKDFYKKWLTEFQKDNFIDIEGNLSYIYVYLYSIITQLIADKNINYFLDNFKKIELGYRSYDKIKSSLSFWRICAFLYLDQRNKIWDEIKLSEIFLLDNALTSAVFLPEFEDSFFDGNKMIHIMNEEGLTDFGRRNKEKIGEIATIIFEDFSNEHGKHIIKYFIENFNLHNLTENDLNTLKSFYPKKEKFLENKKLYEKNERMTSADLYYGKVLKNYEFSGFPGFPGDYPYDEPKFKKVLYQEYDDEKVYIPLIVFEAFKNEVKRIFRESENIYREEMDIPRVGEGWVSETELYYKIKEAFPDEKVIHHGRPSWLGRQHLDVYFSEKNIGIEYQGIQHDEPLEHFGGEDGLINRQKLDDQKRTLCEKNNCHLIYVYPDYSFEDVKIDIKRLISLKKN